MVIDWDTIKTEYISSKMSCRELGEKWGISPNIISKKATKDGWKNERRKCGEKTAKKIISRASSARAEAALEGLDVIKYTTDLWTDNLKQLNELIKATPEAMLSNPSFATGVASGLKTTFDLILKMAGMSDQDKKLELDRERLQIEREKFELEKRKWEAEMAAKQTGAADVIVKMELPEGVDFG